MAAEVYIEIECPECEGEGNREIGPECGRPASNCCGGCYHTEICENCSGEGKLEVRMDSDDVQSIYEAIHESDDILSIRQLIKEIIEINS